MQQTVSTKQQESKQHACSIKRKPKSPKNFSQNKNRKRKRKIRKIPSKKFFQRNFFSYLFVYGRRIVATGKFLPTPNFNFSFLQIAQVYSLGKFFFFRKGANVQKE